MVSYIFLLVLLTPIRLYKILKKKLIFLALFKKKMYLFFKPVKDLIILQSMFLLENSTRFEILAK